MPRSLGAPSPVNEPLRAIGTRGPVLTVARGISTDPGPIA